MVLNLLVDGPGLADCRDALGSMGKFTIAVALLPLQWRVFTARVSATPKVFIAYDLACKYEYKRTLISRVCAGKTLLSIVSLVLNNWLKKGVSMALCPSSRKRYVQIMSQVTCAHGLSARSRRCVQSRDAMVRSRSLVKFFPITPCGNALVGSSKGDHEYPSA